MWYNTYTMSNNGIGLSNTGTIYANSMIADSVYTESKGLDGDGAGYAVVNNSAGRIETTTLSYCPSISNNGIIIGTQSCHCSDGERTCSTSASSATPSPK